MHQYIGQTHNNTNRVTILSPLSPFFFAWCSFCFYYNIWPNYVYAGWAAGTENGKTGNKVSDKSFPTISVAAHMSVYVCVCVGVCVCVCESDTLIDVITCALNIYCIGRRHGTFFFIRDEGEWGDGTTQVAARIVKIAFGNVQVKAETVSWLAGRRKAGKGRKAIASRCL